VSDLFLFASARVVCVNVALCSSLSVGIISLMNNVLRLSLPQFLSFSMFFVMLLLVFLCLLTVCLLSSSLVRPPEPESIRWRYLRDTHTPSSCSSCCCCCSSSCCCSSCCSLLGCWLRQSSSWLLSLLVIVCVSVALLRARGFCGVYWGGAFVLVSKFIRAPPLLPTLLLPEM
jgi:hypothetical protein